MADSTMVSRILALRAKFERAGDRSMVRECDLKLRRIGYRPNATAAETVLVEERAEAEARPRRGRPPTRRDV